MLYSELIRVQFNSTNVKEHKAAGLAIEPAIKFFGSNPVVAGHMVTEILSFES